MEKSRFDFWMGLAAIAAFVSALAWASHAGDWNPRHALAMPGATTAPGAGVFNLLAFVAPGGLLLVAALSRRWRSRNEAGTASGIALWLFAIAALAWIALGLSPVDGRDLADEGSQGHAALWVLWLVAASAAVVCAVLAAARGKRGAMTVLALLWLVVVLVLPSLLEGWAQVLAALAWMAWPWLPVDRGVAAAGI